MGAETRRIRHHLPPEGITFHWRHRSRGFMRLAFFIMVSLAGHAFAFYLFQVAYPVSERTLPYTARLTILDPNDSTTRVVMARIEDRAVVVDAATRLQVPDTSLKILFEPIYQNYELQLKSPPSLFPQTGLPELFPPGEHILDPLVGRPERPIDPLPPEFERMPHMTMRGAELGKRDLKVPLEWQPELLGELRKASEPGTIYEVTCMIGVDAAGQVMHCMIDEGAEAPMVDAISRAIKGLQFESRPGERLQWGWVELRW